MASYDESHTIYVPPIGSISHSKWDDDIRGDQAAVSAVVQRRSRWKSKKIRTVSMRSPLRRRNWRRLLPNSNHNMTTVLTPTLTLKWKLAPIISRRRGLSRAKQIPTTRIESSGLAWGFPTKRRINSRNFYLRRHIRVVFNWYTWSRSLHHLPPIIHSLRSKTNKAEAAEDECRRQALNEEVDRLFKAGFI